MNKFNEWYREATYHDQIYPIVEGFISVESKYLADYLTKSLLIILNFLKINTTVKNRTDIRIGGLESNLKMSEKIIRVCNHLRADIYINAPGGCTLYVSEDFQKNGIQLRFLESTLPTYPQLNHPFVPNLSILDVMMFNEPDKICETFLPDYKIGL